jgi:hypothetical protein
MQHRLPIASLECDVAFGDVELLRDRVLVRARFQENVRCSPLPIYDRLGPDALCPSALVVTWTFARVTASNLPLVSLLKAHLVSTVSRVHLSCPKMRLAFCDRVPTIDEGQFATFAVLSRAHKGRLDLALQRLDLFA